MFPKIRSAHFQLTVRCNLNCSFCGQSRGMAGCASGEIAPGKWLELAGQLREFGLGAQTLTLWGGEPMLYSGFNYLSRQLYALGHKLQTVTNATQLENSCEVLSECFDTIFISLDGLREQHDAVRGSGVFDKVKQNLPLLKDRRGKVVFLCTVSDVNVDKIPDILPEMSELGCDEIVLQQLMYLTKDEIAEYRQYSMENFGCDYPELSGWERNDDCEYLKKLSGMLAEIRNKKYAVPVKFTEHAFGEKQFAPCRKRLERIHIRHDGEVGFCTDYFGFSAGNVKKQSLLEILTGEQAERFHKAVEENKLATCSHCPWRLQ